MKGVQVEKGGGKLAKKLEVDRKRDDANASANLKATEPELKVI